MKTWSCLLFLPCVVLVADLPAPVLPEGVGVNIHFTRGREHDLDLIAAAGFKIIRMDFNWSAIERTKGEYDWSAYDELTANLDKRGLRALFIFDYSNPLYEDTITSTNQLTRKPEQAVRSPQHAASIAAFAHWAGEAARHFRGRRVIWEIWNEPNIGFWKPEADARQYSALAVATCRAIRKADPQATIIAPGSSTFPWPFFETLFASGVLRELNAISVHPYRSGPPETVLADYQKLRALIARQAPTDKRNLPILSGEWGYPTHDKGVSLEKPAAYLARQQLVNLYAGVPLSIWYDWRNDGIETNYNEHNFGTMTHNLQPKPSYRAAQTLTRELAGYRIARRLEMADTNDWALLCIKPDGSQKLAAWTLGAPHSATLMPLSKPLPVELTEIPQYIAIQPPDPALTLAAAWRATAQPDVLITATTGGRSKISVQACNPRDARLQLQLTVAGFAAEVPPVVLDLPPHGSATAELSGYFQRRDQETLNATVQAVFSEHADGGTWAGVGQSSQQVDFVLADPLYVSVAPVESGLRVQIENPAGIKFAGQLRAGDQMTAVTLKRGVTHHTVDLAAASTLSLLDGEQRVVAKTDPSHYQALTILAFRAALDGKASVPAKASIVSTNAPDVEAPFHNAFKLDYDFADGWRFVRCVPDIKERIVIAGHPQALGLWIYGDKSGNRLSARVIDGTYQTFQINGPAVDWTGWRWITLPLDDLRHAGSWGGAKDGVAHEPLRWDCPLLLDSHGHKTAGTIYFAGLTLLYAHE